MASTLSMNALLDELVPTAAERCVPRTNAAPREDISASIERAQDKQSVFSMAAGILRSYGFSTIDDAIVSMLDFCAPASGHAMSIKARALLGMSALRDHAGPAARKLALERLAQCVEEQNPSYVHYEVFHLRRICKLQAPGERSKPAEDTLSTAAARDVTEPVDSRAQLGTQERMKRVVFEQLCEMLGAPNTLRVFHGARDVTDARKLQRWPNGLPSGGAAVVAARGLHPENVANYFRCQVNGQTSIEDADLIAAALLPFRDSKGDVMICGPSFGALTELRRLHGPRLPIEVARHAFTIDF